MEPLVRGALETVDSPQVDTGAAVSPRSDNIVHSFWLERSLGRQRREPSYQLDLSEFGDPYQGSSNKKIKKQVHIEKTSEAEIIEVATPLEGKSLDKVEVGDFTFAKANFGRSTRQTYVSLVKIVTNNLEERVMKDKEDKALLKAKIRQLRQYISDLVHGNPNIALVLPQSTPAEQQNLDQLVNHGKLLDNWVEDFIVTSRHLLAELYQLRCDVHGLRQGI